MNLVHFGFNGVQRYGVIENDMVKVIDGDIFGRFEITSNMVALEDIKILPPCAPSKVVAVGLNYNDHIKEFGNRDIPKSPVLFVKLPHTVVGHEDTILIPKNSTRVDYEAELAVVIKKECRNVVPEEVNEFLLGATCLNDITERDIQRSDGQWIRGKNFETFCPMGPFIVTDVDYNNLGIKSYLNGELKQDSNTSYQIWNVQQLVSFISYAMPLYPGDVVTTGTPSGVGPMKDGDIIEVVVEKVGTLRNTVKNMHPITYK